MQSFRNFFENRQSGKDTGVSLNDATNTAFFGGFIPGEDTQPFFPLIEASHRPLDADTYKKQQTKTPVLFDDDDIKFLMQFPTGKQRFALAWRYGAGLRKAATYFDRTGKFEEVGDVEFDNIKFPNVNLYMGSLVTKLIKPFNEGGAYQFDLFNWGTSVAGKENQEVTNNYASLLPSTANNRISDWASSVPWGLLGKASGLPFERVVKAGRKPGAAGNKDAEGSIGYFVRDPQTGRLSPIARPRGGLKNLAGYNQTRMRTAGSGQESDGGFQPILALKLAPVTVAWDGKILDNSKGYVTPMYTPEYLQQNKILDAKYFRGSNNGTTAELVYKYIENGKMVETVDTKRPLLLPGKMYTENTWTPFSRQIEVLQAHLNEYVVKKQVQQPGFELPEISNIDDIKTHLGEEAFAHISESVKSITEKLPDSDVESEEKLVTMTPEQHIAYKFSDNPRDIPTRVIGGTEPTHNTSGHYEMGAEDSKKIEGGKKSYDEVMKKYLIGQSFINNNLTSIATDQEIENPIWKGVKSFVGQLKQHPDARGMGHVHAMDEATPDVFEGAQDDVQKNTGLKPFKDFFDAVTSGDTQKASELQTELFKFIGRRAYWFAGRVSQFDLGFGRRSTPARHIAGGSANDGESAPDIADMGASNKGLGYSTSNLSRMADIGQDKERSRAGFDDQRRFVFPNSIQSLKQSAQSIKSLQLQKAATEKSQTYDATAVAGLIAGARKVKTEMRQALLFSHLQQQQKAGKPIDIAAGMAWANAEANKALKQQGVISQFADDKLAADTFSAEQKQQIVQMLNDPKLAAQIDADNKDIPMDVKNTSIPMNKLPSYDQYKQKLQGAQDSDAAAAEEAPMALGLDHLSSIVTSQGINRDVVDMIRDRKKEILASVKTPQALEKLKNLADQTKSPVLIALYASARQQMNVAAA